MDSASSLTPLAGRRPALPDGVRIYAIGDVHGRLDLLRELEALISADAASAGGMRIVQVMLGDYVDRGPESRGVIEHLIARRGQCELLTLRGNHEAYMLDAGVEPAVFARWCRFGGRETLLSYGIDLGHLDDAAVEAASAALSRHVRDALPRDHKAFLTETRLHWSCGDYLFVHAGIRPGVPLALQTDEDLIWIRRDFLDSAVDHGCVVVHGHTPTDAPEIRANRIGIDTRAFSSGVLTCLVLQGDSRRFLATGRGAQAGWSA